MLSKPEGFNNSEIAFSHQLKATIAANNKIASKNNSE